MWDGAWAAEGGGLCRLAGDMAKEVAVLLAAWHAYYLRASVLHDDPSVEYMSGCSSVPDGAATCAKAGSGGDLGLPPLLVHHWLCGVWDEAS
jgi:hypothetical protein